MSALVTMLPLLFLAPAGVEFDWPARVQKPYEHLPEGAAQLTPLLTTPAGDAITNPSQWERERRRLQDLWLRRLGTTPRKPPALDTRLEASTILTDHERRLVSFRSEGDDRQQAYVLIPRRMKSSERRAAVVVFHQTSAATFREPIGLAGDPQMAIALELTRRGYVTLSPLCYIMKGDGPLDQAQRLHNRRPGWTGLGKMTFDASRAVDYLETLNAVDPNRIACIGHSLGAKQVLYALAFEPRYRVGVFSEGGIGLTMSNWTDAWYLTSAMREHIPKMENHQVLAMAAPRAMLVVAGDSADGDSSWAFVKQARRVYALLGCDDRIGLYNHHRGHRFPSEARDIAYRWVDHWLDGSRGNPRP